MTSLPNDLWAMILVLLPLKTITSSKLVSKQWKSIVESSLFRDLFLSHHENSHPPSWSLICKNNPTEVMAHYGCKIWGLQRSLLSYINSFITTKFVNPPDIYRHARVVAYTNVGLVLIRVVSLFGNVSFYVANPVSQECIETDPPWFEPMQYFWPLGIATRTEKNGVLSGFKVVLIFDVMPCQDSEILSLLIYSSETGVWSPQNVHVPFSSSRQDYHNAISSKGNLHWFARKNNNDEVVVSIDLYSADSGSVRCLVTPFPDLGKVPKFNRACTTSQGFLMYINVISITNDGRVEDKFRVWRLTSGEWQLVFEIAHEHGFNIVPFEMNPVDGNSIYFNNLFSHNMVSMNLLNGKLVYLNKFELSSDGAFFSSIELVNVLMYMRNTTFSSFVLPKWMHPIPKMVRKA